MKLILEISKKEFEDGVCGKSGSLDEEIVFDLIHSSREISEVDISDVVEYFPDLKQKVIECAIDELINQIENE